VVVQVFAVVRVVLVAVEIQAPRVQLIEVVVAADNLVIQAHKVPLAVQVLLSFLM
jgi:hypothetical protein